METRLVNIEEKIAHLERHLGELDGVVREVYDRMDGFKRQIDKLQSVVESRDEAGGTGHKDQQLEDDKPPHW